MKINLLLLLKANINVFAILLSVLMLLGCDQNTKDKISIVTSADTVFEYDESASCPSTLDNNVNDKIPANKIQVNINFQPSNADIPRDYLVDTGLLFDNRSNGYNYGWSKDISEGARDRDHNNAKDQRYDTLLHMLHPSLNINDFWEIELPNNNYKVKLVAGDPEYCDKLYQIAIEDVPFITEAPGCSYFIENTANVEVTDGYLTVKTLADSIDAKLLFIEITEINNLPDIAPPSTVYNENITVMNKQLLVEWKNPLHDFAGTLLLYDTEPINFSPTQNIDYTNYKNIKGVRFIVQEGENRALLSRLKNEQIYCIKIFSFDESFNYAAPINLTAAPLLISTQQEKEISENLMESLQAGNSPEVVYDTFQNFAKTHFGALITPQIYKKFGNTLKIIEISKWRHISKYSAVIAWETNLPAKTVIEYHKQGEKDQTTELSERYFYNHVHYLTNLEPNTVYIYKIRATDERELSILSAGTFTTGLQGEVIEIPGDMGNPPYILEKSNVTYLLTEDITSPSGAIQIQASPIILDLGGHKITFANEYHDTYKIIDINENAIGIYRSGYKNENADIKIFNGTIIQSNTMNEPSIAGVLNPMYLQNQKGIEIAGITIDYHTPQTYGIRLQSASGTVRIHHNIFKDRGSVITNRHGGGGARPISFGGLNNGNNDFEIHNNLIKRTRQNGLMYAQKIYNNEIYVDSWATNSFAIQPHGEEGVDSGSVSGNKIFLTGYHAIGIAWGRQNLLVNDNFIHMEGINTEKNRWYESFGDQNSLNGLRLTNYGAGGQIRNNLHYTDNLIIGNARHGSMIRGTELFGDYSITNTLVNNSIIEMNAEGEETIRVSAVVTQGTASKESNPTYYTDTILTSNITNVRFGDNYGKGYNHHLYNVTFNKSGNNPNYHTFIFDGGYSRDGHIIRDPIFTNGAQYDDVYWERTGDLSAYSIEWTLTVEAEIGETIEVYDVNNILVFEGAITDHGNIDIPLKEVTIRPKQWTIDSHGSGVKEKSEHQKIMHTPHRVLIKNKPSSEKNITLNETKTIKL
jgi:hypothetical protein